MRRLGWLLLCATLAAGCDGPEGGALPTRAPASAHAVGNPCEPGQDGWLCAGLRYVAYRDGGGPVVDEGSVADNLDVINTVWAACRIRFQIEEYFEADPSGYGLGFDPSQYSELTDIRRAFASDNRLLVVTTGAWGRDGSLGSTRANAWTTMPSGSGPFGAVLESSVARYSIIFAHELGHYLGLSHVSDGSDVMNAVIYTTSTRLSSSQCETARATLSAFWRAMLR